VIGCEASARSATFLVAGEFAIQMITISL
jgi:hypothetical protein